MLYLLLACAPASDDTSATDDGAPATVQAYDYDCDGDALSWREDGPPAWLESPLVIVAWHRTDGDGESLWEPGETPAVVVPGEASVACVGYDGGRLVVLR